MFKKTATFFKLLRVNNLCLLALTQGLLIWQLYPIFLASNVIISLLFLLQTALIAGRGYMLNDWFDRQADRVNRPKRPLVSGKITSNEFRVLYILTIFISVGLFLQLPVRLVWQWLLAELLLLAYARWNKRWGIWANLCVAGLSAWSILLVGFWIGTFPFKLLFFAGMAFGLHFLREIIKDLEDQEGDRLQDARSLALCWGEKRTLSFFRWSTGVVLLGLVGFGWFFHSLAAYGLLLFIASQLLFLIYQSFRVQSTSAFRRMSLHLKLLMLAGLFLLFI